jgi:fucose 4-O-acetylase-like acetyltransferase
MHHVSNLHAKVEPALPQHNAAMPTASTGNSRDFLIDNLKALLIVLVVFGHFVEPYSTQSAYLKAAFIVVNSFHMPVFVFLSGYLSKKASSTTKLISNLLIPYVLFNLLWNLRQSMHFHTFSFNLFSPAFHLWYLLSLFTWRLLLPFVQSIKYSLLFSIMLALLVGLSHSVDNDFSLSRTFSLFPFFLAGTLCSADRLSALHAKKYLALFGLIYLPILFYYVMQHVNNNWSVLFWAQPYQVAGYGNVEGLLLRLGTMVAASLTGLSMLALTPARQNVFTLLGARTITVYIAHGFFVNNFAVRFPSINQSVFHTAVIMAFPVVVIFVFSLPVVGKWYQRLIDFCSRLVLRPTM